MRPGTTHSPETRAKIAETARAKMQDPARRAQISIDTKQRMADPAVRQRIKDGMLEASGRMAEMRMLRAAWRAACPAVRSRFLSELFSPVCSASASEPVDRDISE